MIRHTHTYAELEVSPAAYFEVQSRLIEADYHHLVDAGAGPIDMAGIALTTSADAVDPAKQELDAVYRERNLVVALAAKLALQHTTSFAWLGRHQPKEGEGWDPEWTNVVFITVKHPFDETPVQLSWHIHDRELDTFAFLPDLREAHRRQVEFVEHHAFSKFVDVQPWDGHTTEEKYQRILRFVGALGPAAQADGAG